MAGKSDIEAGKAHVSLYVKNSELVKGLQAASKQLKSFGESIAKIGGSMMAAGGAILAPMAAMVKGFADVGSQLADMSARTGVAAETLSALGYAAGMTGTSIEDVEKALRKMQQNGMSTDQLGAIADQMAAIEDPAERTRFAIETFGKSGAALIPMLSGGAAGLAEFRAEAERLGLVMSSEDASAADALGDAMDRVTGALKGVALQIGAALAPVMTYLADTITGVVAQVVEFVRNNREMVVTVAAVAAGVVAVGAVITGLGGAVAAAGFALSGLASIMGVVGTIAAAIASPIGLVVAGIAAAGAAFASVSGVTSYFAYQLGTVWTAVKGIAVALMSGEFGKAWDMAKLAMLAVGSAMIDMFTQLPEFIGYAIGRTARAIVDGMKSAMDWVQQAWQYMFVAILDSAMKVGPEILKALMTGGTGNAMRIVGDAVAQAFGEAQKGLAAIGAGWNKEGAPEFRASERTRGFAADLAALSSTVSMPTIGGSSSPYQSQQPVAQATAVEPANGPGQADYSAFDTRKQIYDEMAQYAEQQRQAAAAMEAAKRRNQQSDVQLPELNAGTRLGGTASSFSAAALSALGGGGGAMDRLVRVNEDQKKNQQRQIDLAASLDAKIAQLNNMLLLTS
jgi:hypothetical protein